ncbi:MAG: tripartite tricarboxylate transporter TctB family protein [Alphaproteobacteria bacterium HGW-Alphaproteobacteria-8]|nr:MAG: tripartite tricarboxylate transporter TctB family protein [Alphaproteobacteria bacterium HGW-Alphaproteobacteria-8]
MRIAELATAAALMALSLYFMAYAAALPIGWEETSGPGGGAFPFWLSAGMFVCAALVFVRKWRAAPARSGREPHFIDPAARGQMLAAAGGLTATVALTMVAGVYVAIPLFMIAYIRFVGRNSWTVALSLAIGTVLFMFFFFEVTLKILLPKGFTEPLFYPLYAIFF